MKYETVFYDRTNRKEVSTLDAKIILKVQDSIVIHGADYIVFDVLYTILKDETGTDNIFRTIIHLLPS